MSAKQHVPPGIPKPPYADSGFLPDMSERPQVHDAEGIEKMRAAGLLAAQVLDFAESIVKPGITTDYIDRQVHKMIVDARRTSSLNYGGFPKSVCTSLNECICHGIPDTTELMEGDIINIDVTVYLDGHHGDTSRTVCVGKVTDEARALVDATDACLKAAIDVCGPGVPVRKIGATIHALADELGYGVVEKFVGHGVGREFHSGPPSDTTATTTGNPPGRANIHHRAHAHDRKDGRSDVEGRVDGGDRGRKVDRAVRTHAPHHRRRRRHSHSVAQGTLGTAPAEL